MAHHTSLIEDENSPVFDSSDDKFDDFLCDNSPPYQEDSIEIQVPNPPLPTSSKQRSTFDAISMDAPPISEIQPTKKHVPTGFKDIPMDQPKPAVQMSTNSVLGGGGSRLLRQKTIVKAVETSSNQTPEVSSLGNTTPVGNVMPTNLPNPVIPPANVEMSSFTLNVDNENIQFGKAPEINIPNIPHVTPSDSTPSTSQITSGSTLDFPPMKPIEEVNAIASQLKLPLANPSPLSKSAVFSDNTPSYPPKTTALPIIKEENMQESDLKPFPSTSMMQTQIAQVNNKIVITKKPPVPVSEDKLPARYKESSLQIEPDPQQIIQPSPATVVNTQNTTATIKRAAPPVFPEQPPKELPPPLPPQIPEIIPNALSVAKSTPTIPSIPIYTQPSPIQQAPHAIPQNNIYNQPPTIQKAPQPIQSAQPQVISTPQPVSVATPPQQVAFTIPTQTQAPAQHIFQQQTPTQPIYQQPSPIQPVYQQPIVETIQPVPTPQIQPMESPQVNIAQSYQQPQVPVQQIQNTAPPAYQQPVYSTPMVSAPPSPIYTVERNFSNTLSRSMTSFRRYFLNEFSTIMRQPPELSVDYDVEDYTETLTSEVSSIIQSPIQLIDLNDQPLARKISTSLDEQIKPLTSVLAESDAKNSKAAEMHISELKQLQEELDNLRNVFKQNADGIIRELEREKTNTTTLHDIEKKRIRDVENKIRQIKLRQVELEAKSTHQNAERDAILRSIKQLEQKRADWEEEFAPNDVDDSSSLRQRILSEITNLRHEIGEDSFEEINGSIEEAVRLLKEESSNMRNELYDLELANRMLANKIQLTQTEKMIPKRRPPKKSAIVNEVQEKISELRRKREETKDT